MPVSSSVSSRNNSKKTADVDCHEGAPENISHKTSNCNNANKNGHLNDSHKHKNKVCDPMDDAGDSSDDKSNYKSNGGDNKTDGLLIQHGSSDDNEIDGKEKNDSIRQDQEFIFIHDTCFNITISSPGKKSFDIQVSPMEMVQEIHHLLMDREDTCHRTCFSLQLDGNNLDNFAELKNIEGLKEGSVLEVVKQPYTVREARIHLRHIRDLLKSLDSSDAYNGLECNSLSFLNVIAQGDLFEKRKGMRPDSIDCTPPGYILPGSKERPLTALQPQAKDQKNFVALKVLTTSGWNPPPGWRKLQGDILYLYVVTLEDKRYHITSSTHGFYVNQSTEEVFDPRPAPPRAIYHSLIDLLDHISPLFKKNFAIIQKKKHQKHLFERVATPYQMYCWTAPMLEHSVDHVRAEDAFSSKLGYEEHIPGQTRDWNEELQTTRELPRKTLPERLLRERAIFKVHSDFVAAATRGAMAVVDGNVMAINPGEDPKMQMFIWNNIFFSLGFDVRDHYRQLGGDAAAYVAPNNDLQGVKAYSAVDIEGLHTLGTVVIDYRSYRVTAQSIIPGILEREQEQSVVYGSVDFGKTVVTHAKYLELLDKAGQILKIVPHKVLNEKDQEVEICSSVECKGIIGNDGRHYILDLLRTFPPDVNFFPLPLEQYSGEVRALGFPKEHHHKLCCLRQELVDAFFEAKYMMFIKLAAYHLQQSGLRKIKVSSANDCKQINQDSNHTSNDTNSDDNGSCLVNYSVTSLSSSSSLSLSPRSVERDDEVIHDNDTKLCSSNFISSSSSFMSSKCEPKSSYVSTLKNTSKSKSSPSSFNSSSELEGKDFSDCSSPSDVPTSSLSADSDKLSGHAKNQKTNEDIDKDCSRSSIEENAKFYENGFRRESENFYVKCVDNKICDLKSKKAPKKIVSPLSSFSTSTLDQSCDKSAVCSNPSTNSESIDLRTMDGTSIKPDSLVVNQALNEADANNNSNESSKESTIYNSMKNENAKKHEGHVSTPESKSPSCAFASTPSLPNKEANGMEVNLAAQEKAGVPDSANLTDAEDYKKMLESFTLGKGKLSEDSTQEIVRKAAKAVKSLKETEFDIRFNPDVYSPTVRHANEGTEELNNQRQLVKDAAEFLLTVQIPNFIKDCLDNSTAPFDGVTLTEALHSRGINVRYLGVIANQLANYEQLEYLKAVVVTEILCRSAKHIYIGYIQEVEMMYLAAAISHFLNCLLSSCHVSNPIREEKPSKKKGKKGRGRQNPLLYPNYSNEWGTLTSKTLFESLSHKMFSYYGWEVDTQSIDSLVNKYNLQKISMLRSFCMKTGIQVLLREYSFDVRSKPTFSEDDILNVFPVVKHINPRATDAYNFYTNGQAKIQQGFLKEGYELISEALNLLNNVYGAMHPEIAQCLRMLARLNYIMGDYSEAMACQQKAVLMSEKVNGIDHPYTITEYSHLALYCFANSQVSIALKLLYRSRYLLLLISGENHPEMAILDSNIGLVLYAVAEYEFSLKFLTNALKLNIRYFGKKSLKVAVSYHLIARTQSCMGDFRGALANERETWAIYKHQLGENHEKTKESSECLRHLTQQAVLWQKKINEIYKGDPSAVIPPIQIQPPFMSSVLEMLNIINGFIAQSIFKSSLPCD